MTDAPLELFRQGLKDAARQRRSDDIVDFICGHWRLFCPGRQVMGRIREELEQRGDLSVSALCEALGVDPRVMFKRASSVDTARLLMSPRGSALMKAFLKEREKHADGLCLVVVSGARSLAMTDMRTSDAPGSVVLRAVGAEGVPTVDVFPAQDAPVRLPSVFDARSNEEE